MIYSLILETEINVAKDFRFNTFTLIHPSLSPIFPAVLPTASLDPVEVEPGGWLDCVLQFQDFPGTLGTVPAD